MIVFVIIRGTAVIKVLDADTRLVNTGSTTVKGTT